MQSFLFGRRAVVGAALLLGLASASHPLTAQRVPSALDRPHFGLGYAANAPNLMAGGEAYVVTPYLGGVGLYVDAKFDVEDPSGEPEYISDLTAEDVANQISGAEFIRRESAYKSFNVAVLKAMSPYLMLYAGGGVVRRTRYHFYEAAGTDYGVSGVFWVKAPSEDVTRPNAMLGIFMRMSTFLSAQVGIETEPRGFTVGASFRLPER